MAQIGRPPKGDDRMVSISLRLPTQLHEQYKQTGVMSSLMREALETFMLTYTPERDKHS
jgi:hypothetical protein